MKKLYAAMVLAFAFVCMPLFAQETGVTKTPEAAAESAKEVKKDVWESKTKAFGMGEIVVRDQAVPNIEQASTVTDISGEDIEKRGDKSLGDSLRMVPGVNVYQSAKGYEVFSIRGFDQKMAAILIDGIPVLDPYYGGNNTDISSIPVANVSHIVVNRGVASALYGALGSIGSINIVTKQPEQLTAAGKVEYGEHNNYMVSAEAGAPIGDFYAWIAASYRHSDGYEISKKLDKKERRKWFDKLVQYGLFINSDTSLPYTYDEVTLAAKNNYINDTGKWNHTSYEKYTINGRVGYNITNTIETGISASYYSNVQDSNTFSSTTTISWKDTNWGNFPTAPAPKHKDPSFTGDGKSAAFQNRAFSWPEDTRLSVSPYLKAEFGDLLLRMNVFYIAQRNNLEGWANQAETMMMFPPSVYDVTKVDSSNPDLRRPYGTDQVQSIYEETAYGFFLLPTYKIADWNKLAATIHYRFEVHEKLEKAINSAVASGVVGIHGTGEYKVQDMGSQYVTLALEDEMRFKTTAGNVFVTAGISYDAQDITQLKLRSNNFANGTLNQMVEAYYAKADTILWGTRDSLNPVLAVVYDPIKDFLRLRAAGAMKTKFPSLDIYKDITETTDLTIEPERIYTTNAGFELFFLNNALSFRNDYFYTRINDKIESVYNVDKTSQTYTNIDGYVVQGVESTVQGTLERIGGIMDVTATIGYVYSYARNYDDSTVTKGKSVEEIPVHQVLCQLALNFVTKTQLMLWGNYTNNQKVYVLASNPSATSPGVYTTDVYKTIKLHNPLMLNVKLSQNIMENFDVYVMCKNVFDDYNADPFNPGPGRMFYIGGSARL